MPRYAITMIVALLVLGLLDCSLANPPRRYELESGQKAIYSIEVEFGDGKTAWHFAGTSNYTVLSLIDGAAQVRVQGILDQRNGKPVSNWRDRPFSGFSGISNPPRRRFEPRKEKSITFSVNDHGEGLRTIGSSHLPYLIGELHEIILIPLPDESTDHWRREADLEIVVSDDGNLGQYVRRSNAVILGDGERDSEQATRLTAIETIEFEPANDGGYHRRYWLRTKEKTVGRPRVELKTEGLVRFSDDGFLPAFVEYSGKLIARDGLNQSGRSVHVTAKRLTTKDLLRRAELATKEREEAERRMALARAKADERRKKAYEQLIADLDDLIVELNSGDGPRVREAARRLEDVTGETPNRPEVAKALHDALVKAEDHARSTIGKALVKWATPKQTQYLIDLLNEEDFWIRRATMEALGKRKDKKAIPALAARLGDDHDTISAINALEQYGPVAEEAVLKQLGDQHWSEKMKIVGLLGDIGTKKSLPVLKKLESSDESSIVRNHAEDAIDAIESRIKQGKPEQD